jgi:hypothetical protein
MGNEIALDQEFEKFLKETYPESTYDFTVENNTKGRYADKTVALMYAAFKRSYKDAKSFLLNRPIRSKVNIVARSENGKLKFPDNIFVHHTVEGAQIDADRLSEKLKTKVHVFSKVSTHEYKPK